MMISLPLGRRVGFAAWLGLATAGAAAAQSPVPPSISTDGLFTCAMLEGHAHCWDYQSASPELPGGQWDTTPHPLEMIRGPAPVPGDPGVLSIRVGQGYACGLTPSGELWCIGMNGQRRFAPYTAESAAVPCASRRCAYRMIRVAAPLTFGEFAVGEQSMCGVTAQGRLYCWGRNESGELAAAAPARGSDRPLAVAAAPRFTRLAMGHYHGCGLTDEGVAWCWGANVGRSREDIERPGFPRGPVRVDTDQRFVSLSAGYEATCGLTREGAAWCWGHNSRNWMGLPAGDSVDYAAQRPRQVALDERFRSFSVGWGDACGLTTDGRVRCLAPRPATAPPAERLLAVAAGNGTYCGITVRSEVVCWGNLMVRRRPYWRTVRPPTVIPRVPMPPELGGPVAPAAPSGAAPAPSGKAGRTPPRGLPQPLRP